MLGAIFRCHPYYTSLVLVLFSAIRVIRAILGQRPRGLIRPIPTRFRYSFPVLYRQLLVHRRQPSLSDSIRIYLPECLAMRSASRRPQDKRPPAVSSAPQHSRQFVQAAANRGSSGGIFVHIYSIFHWNIPVTCDFIPGDESAEPRASGIDTGGNGTQ